MREAILAVEELKGHVNVVGTPTEEVTGWLEVQIVGGPLLHSKKNGDGLVTQKKMNAMIEEIIKFLKAKQEKNKAQKAAASSPKAG